jgi:hypothetical protein
MTKMPLFIVAVVSSFFLATQSLPNRLLSSMAGIVFLTEFCPSG